MDRKKVPPLTPLDVERHKAEGGFVMSEDLVDAGVTASVDRQVASHSLSDAMHESYDGSETRASLHSPGTAYEAPAFYPIRRSLLHESHLIKDRDPPEPLLNRRRDLHVHLPPPSQLDCRAISRSHTIADLLPPERLIDRQRDVWCRVGYQTCVRHLGTGSQNAVYLAIAWSEERSPKYAAAQVMQLLPDRVQRQQLSRRERDPRIRPVQQPRSVVSQDVFPQLLAPLSLQREVHCLRGLRHVNVIALLDVYAVRETACAYLLLEYADGLTLHHELDAADGRRFPVPKARFFFRQLMAGLAYLHSRHVAHRNIQPRNLQLKVDQERSQKLLKIANFSVAAVLGHPVGPADAGHWVKRDLVTNVVGLLAFQAPEALALQLHKVLPQVMQTYHQWPMTAEAAAAPSSLRHVHRVSEHRARRMIWNKCYGSGTYPAKPADVYAAGVTLYLMLTGTLPYNALSWPQRLDLVFRAQPLAVDFLSKKDWKFLLWLLEPKIDADSLTDEFLERGTADQVLQSRWMQDPEESGGADLVRKLTSYQRSPILVPRGPSLPA